MENCKGMVDLLPDQEIFITKVNGKMISRMEKEFKFIQMGLDTKGNLWMVKKMTVMDIIDGQTEKFIKALLETDLWKGMENYTCKMEKANILVSFIVIWKLDMERWGLKQVNIQELLKMEKCMGQVFLNGMMVNRIKDNFRMVKYMEME